MKVILAMVLSVDGKSTRGGEPPKKWASREDQKLFSKLNKENNLIVMGGNTFSLAQAAIKADPRKLKVILTKDPKKFEKYKVPGQLEFSSENPGDLVIRLEKLGFKQMLLVSGENLNGQFFKDKLINEIWITMEPKIFGEGKGMVNVPVNIQLKLIGISKLNKNGTLLIKYHVS